MRKIRFDLIHEELYGKHADGLKYHKFKLSKRLIERLFRHYYVHEFTEHFFDSEPDIDDELYDMSYDYKFEKDPWNLPEYEGKNYTKEDFKAASEEVKRLYREYRNSERRLTFNNWIEVFGEGIWSMTQERVDRIAYENLEYVRKNLPHKDRCYIAYGNGVIKMYIYSRDIRTRDLWFIFKKRKRRLEKLIKITN